MEVLKRSVNVSQLKSVFKSAEQVNGFRGVLCFHTLHVYIYIASNDMYIYLNAFSMPVFGQKNIIVWAHAPASPTLRCCSMFVVSIH